MTGGFYDSAGKGPRYVLAGAPLRREHLLSNFANRSRECPGRSDSIGSRGVAVDRPMLPQNLERRLER